MQGKTKTNDDHIRSVLKGKGAMPGFEASFDRADAVLVHRGDMSGIASARENAPMNYRMKGFNPPIHHLRKARVVVDARDLDTRRFEQRRRPARGDDLYAQLLQQQLYPGMSLKVLEMTPDKIRLEVDGRVATLNVLAAANLTAKVQDEVGHGQMLYRVSQDLGKPRDAMLRDLIVGKTKYHNVFNYPAPTWGDIAMIQWLIDGAAIMNQKTLADGAYGPYVRTMRRINMEEAFHFKSGEDMVLTLMSGTTGQKKMAQEAFERRALALHTLVAPHIVGERGETPGHTTVASPEAFERANYARALRGSR